MRLGFWEIGIIVAVIIIIYIATRMMRSGQDGNRKKKAEPKHPRLKLTGIALTILGIIFLLASVSLAKWIFWSNIWAFIILAAGVLIIFLTRRKS